MDAYINQNSHVQNIDEQMSNKKKVTLGRPYFNKFNLFSKINVDRAKWA